MSVTLLLLDMTSYDSLFLERLLMGLGVEIVVSIFLLRGALLVERMLDCCAFMYPLNEDS